jgi:hypothetical protein
MGNHAFSGRKVNTIICRGWIKTVQNPYSLNRLYETGSAKLAIEKMVASLFSNGFWCAIRKILTGEKHPKAGLVCFLNIQGTTAQCTEATKLYQEMLEKKV